MGMGNNGRGNYNKERSRRRFRIKITENYNASLKKKIFMKSRTGSNLQEGLIIDLSELM